MRRGAHHNAGIALHAAGHLVEAAAAFRKSLELAPQGAATHAYLSLVLLAQGRGDDAFAGATREPDEAFRLWALAIIHHAMGHRHESDAALEGLIEKDAEGAAYQIAEVCASRGEVERAFEWLERAHAQRDGGLFDLKLSPRFLSLHGDPRWGAFLKKMGLPG